MEPSLRKVIEEIKEIEGVKKVSVVSRTGIPVNGDTYQAQETFAAMSAIILGAAETAASTLGTVKKVIISLDSGDMLLLLPAGRRGILVLLTEKDVSGKLDYFREKLKNLI